MCITTYADLTRSVFFRPQAPCRAELQRALDRLASNTRTHDDLFTIPIPNCDKNGDFHIKQVCALMPRSVETRCFHRVSRQQITKS